MGQHFAVKAGDKFARFISRHAAFIGESDRDTAGRDFVGGLGSPIIYGYYPYANGVVHRRQNSRHGESSSAGRFLAKKDGGVGEAASYHEALVGGLGQTGCLNKGLQVDKGGRR
jgi:hypothetical protein